MAARSCAVMLQKGQFTADQNCFDCMFSITCSDS